MTVRAGRCLLALIVGVATSGAALAHANGASYLRITSGDAGAPLAATWDIAAADLQLPLELDTDGDGVLTAGELAARSSALTRFATDRLGIRRGGVDCVIQPGTPAVSARESETFVSLPLQAVCAADGSLEVSTSLFFGSAGYSALLDVHTQQHRFTGALSMNGATWTEPPVPSVLATSGRFLREGVGHVFIGYDHIAFLLLLLLPSVLHASSSGWVAAARGRHVIRDLLKIVTAFTVAHSVTLGLAATETVHVPTQPIEVAIAASIVVAGVLNLFPAAARWRFPLVLVFGLVHGFGFANALRGIDVSGFRLTPVLVGFNLGVEVAQLLIIAAALPILWLLSRARSYAHRVMPALSIATALTGGVWLIGRL
jgi:hypothetical protein